MQHDSNTESSYRSTLFAVIIHVITIFMTLFLTFNRRTLLFIINIITELQIRFFKFTSIDSTRLISSPNPMFDYLLESSRDDSNKWSNIGFSVEIGILENNKRSLSGAL